MKNRFYYSYSQDCTSRGLRAGKDKERHNYVFNGERWIEYTEWCSLKNSKCNWEDAKLVFETNESPKTKILYIKANNTSEFIDLLQKEILELQLGLERIKWRRLKEWVKANIEEIEEDIRLLFTENNINTRTKIRTYKVVLEKIEELEKGEKHEEK